MKMTKRLATLAACAVMAASSMVGMGAFAAEESPEILERIGTIDLATLSNSNLEGIYTNQSDYSSFISINANSNNMCYFQNVYSNTERLYVSGETSSYAIKNQDENGYFNATLNGSFLTRSNSSASWKTTSISQGQINGTLYAVKGAFNTVQYYVIKVAEGTSNEQVFVQG